MMDALRIARLGAAWGWSFSALVGAQVPPQFSVPRNSLGEAIPEQWIGDRSFWTWTGVTGDWDGARIDLQDLGVNVQGSYIFDWSGLWEGGIGGGTGYRSLLDFNVTLDLDPLIGLPDAEIFVNVVNQVGADFSQREVGDSQVFDNLDSVNFTAIYDLWLQVWIEDWLRVKVGKMDANEDFAYLEEALVFIHSTAGFPPTILAFPTYPDPAVGAVVFTHPVGGWYAGGGIYDGGLQVGIPTGIRGHSGSDEYFVVGETGLAWDASQRLGGGRFAVGAWHASGDFTRFDGSTENGTSGYYVLAEQKLWREPNNGAFDDQGLAVMASYGEADEDVSDFQRTILGGVTYTGLISGRDQDALGALVSYADLSDVPSAGFPQDETAYELYYKMQVTPFFNLQPVLSYIVNPSGQPNIDNALIGTLRGEIAF